MVGVFCGGSFVLTYVLAQPDVVRVAVPCVAVVVSVGGVLASLRSAQHVKYFVLAVVLEGSLCVQLGALGCCVFVRPVGGLLDMGLVSSVAGCVQCVGLAHCRLS